MKIERLGFIAFPVAALDRSRRFYEGTLGLTVVQAASDHIDYDFAGVTVRTYLRDGEYSRQHSGLQFLVSDVDEAHRDLSSKGADLRSAVRSEPWGGRVFTVADPDGNLFDLLDASYAAVAAGA